VSIDDFHDLDDKVQRLPQDNLVDANATEGLRLIVAFKKIRNRADRRKVIELAERLAK
jgi:hypothetical protein